MVEGVLLIALPDVDPWGTRFTSLLVRALGSKPRWYEANGIQPHLLDDALVHQQVRLSWLRYDGGTRRYLDGQVTLVPAEVAGGPRRSTPATDPRQHPSSPQKPPQGLPGPARWFEC